MPKRILQGVVVSDKQDKTVVVRVERRIMHPIYKKKYQISKKFRVEIGKVIPKIMRVKMIFGEPMYFEGDSSDLLHLRDVTDQIMNAIHALSDQEYVDMYAPKKSKRSHVQDDED